MVLLAGMGWGGEEAGTCKTRAGLTRIWKIKLGCRENFKRTKVERLVTIQGVNQKKFRAYSLNPCWMQARCLPYCFIFCFYLFTFFRQVSISPG